MSQGINRQSHSHLVASSRRCCPHSRYSQQGSGPCLRRNRSCRYPPSRQVNCCHPHRRRRPLLYLRPIAEPKEVPMCRRHRLRRGCRYRSIPRARRRRQGRVPRHRPPGQPACLVCRCLRADRRVGSRVGRSWQSARPRRSSTFSSKWIAYILAQNLGDSINTFLIRVCPCPGSS